MGETHNQTWRIPPHWPQVTDQQWDILVPLLRQYAGSCGENTRLQFDGMLYVLESSCQWHMLPPQFGSPHTVSKRFERWAAKGTFRRVYAALYPRDALSRGRTVIIDGSYACVHPDAMGARGGSSGCLCQVDIPEQCPPKRPWYCPETEVIGKTRGGFNTNIVIAVNDDGQLVDWLLLAGNAPESRAMPALLEGLHPALVVADKIHDTNANRKMLERLNIAGAIANHPRRKDPYPWHPAIKLQNVVDRYFSRLKSFRRVATRYEKTRDNYDAVIALAALWIALRQDYPGLQGV